MPALPPEIQRLTGKGFPSRESLEDRFERAIFCSEPLRRFQRMAPKTFGESRRVVLDLLHNHWREASLPLKQKRVSIQLGKLATDPLNYQDGYLYDIFERLLPEEFSGQNEQWIQAMAWFLADSYTAIAQHVLCFDEAFPILASQQSTGAADRLKQLFRRQLPLRRSVRSFEKRGEIITTVDFAPRTGFVAGVMDSGIVRVYDLSGKIIARGSGFPRPRPYLQWAEIGAGVFSARGDQFTGYDRGKLRTFDIGSGKTLLRPLPSSLEGILLKKHGHLQKTRWYGWPADSNPFLLADPGGWELRSVTEGPSGKMLGLFRCGPEMGVLLKPDGKYVFSSVGDACCGHMVKILELGEGYIIESGHGEWLSLIKPGKDHEEEVLDLEKYEGLRSSSDPMTGTINGTRWFSAARESLSCYEGAGLAWRNSTFHLIDVILTLAADAAGNRLAAGTAGGGLHILDQDGEIISTTVMNWPVTALAVSPDGKLIFAGCAGGAVSAYEFV